jgi:polyisoprenoid-binding protein YceI
MTEQLNWLTTRQMPFNRPNGWVILDRTWARTLGVKKDRGVYRIRHRELVRRMDPLAEARNLAGSWTIDPERTKVAFVAPHLVFAKVRGEFSEVSGSLSVGSGSEDSWVDVRVGTASVDTGLSLRDAHLRSADFLDSANHPEMHFRSTELRVHGLRTCTLKGELTVRGVTRPLTLEVEFLGRNSDAGAKPTLGFEARANVDREEFGLVWNRPLEAGGVLVGRHIELQIEAEAVAA